MESLHTDIMGELGPDRELPADSHVTWDCDGAVKIRYGANGTEKRYPPSKPTSVVSWFRQCCSEGGDGAAYAIKDPAATGEWKKTSYAEYYEETNNVRSFIKLLLI